MKKSYNVVAVVVTYNRLTLLKRCLESLQNQTVQLDSIVVINNSSTDGTKEWLETQNSVTTINQGNLGGAGGFYAGLKYGHENNFDWIWCMDDDGYPRQDALEKLLEQHTGKMQLYNSVVLNIEEKRSFVFKTKGFKNIDECKKNVIMGVAHLFNSTLVHRTIIDKVGLPDKRLFVWGDETEYCYRISRRHRIDLVTVTSSIHYHPASTFSYLEDWDYFTNWKMYYFFRNKYPVYLAKYKRVLVAKIIYLFFICLYTANIAVFQKTQKLKKIKFLFNAASDAISKNFEMTPQMILASLKK